MPDAWNWIEKKAFNPRTENDKQKWLSCFHKFLPGMWGIENDWSDWGKPKEVTNLWLSDEMFKKQPLKPLRDAAVGFSYSINYSAEQFSILLFFFKNIFKLDYDNNYLFEFINQSSNQINNDTITYERIKKSISKRISHPALHIHLKRIDDEEFPHHNLRFGFSTNNPFVILYQTAFQLIDYKNGDSDMREQEISRITNIIFSNKNKLQISAGTLFKK